MKILSHGGGDCQSQSEEPAPARMVLPTTTWHYHAISSIIDNNTGLIFIARPSLSDSVGQRYPTGYLHMFLNQLQQHPIRAFRMQEDSTSLGRNARLLIQDGCALLLHLLQRGIDIVNFETDVV